MELVFVAGALAGGAGLAGLAVWAAWRYVRAVPAAQAPVELEVVAEDETPATPRAPPRARAPAPAAVVRPAPARPVMAPPAPGVVAPRGHAERAPAMVLTAGVRLQDAAPAAAPSARAPPAARPPMRQPPPMKSWAQQVMEQATPEVPTEWARRQVGPVEPGRTAGACGGCGARLSVSNARPLRIACPVCGRTKLLAS